MTRGSPGISAMAEELGDCRSDHGGYHAAGHGAMSTTSLREGFSFGAGKVTWFGGSAPDWRLRDQRRQRLPRSQHIPLFALFSSLTTGRR